LVGVLINSLVDSLVGSLVDSLVDRLMGGLMDRLVGVLVAIFMDRLMDRLVGRLIDSLVDRLVVKCYPSIYFLTTRSTYPYGFKSTLFVVISSSSAVQGFAFIIALAGFVLLSIYLTLAIWRLS
jgi:large-conductance mechanosensitive channel